MEEAIVDFVNSQNMEHRTKLIEYLKCWNSQDIDEHIDKRKKIGGKTFQS